MYADENVIKIKHAVLREVAKLAFEGTLDAERDHIAVHLIPGPTPQFRCESQSLCPLFAKLHFAPKSAAGSVSVFPKLENRTKNPCVHLLEYIQ